MKTPNAPSNALLVVAKRPSPGRTKTRLTPPLSPEKAAALYECFLKDTLGLMRQVEVARPALVYLPEHAQGYFRRLAPDFELLLQRGRDLGERLDNAARHYLSHGYRQVVIMDSDSPNLPVSRLNEAFEALSDGNDVVIGPCDDGGYYLIGLKRPAPRLLREVRMSTPDVTRDTLALAAAEGLRVHLLPAWYDVDNAASLARLGADLARLGADLARQPPSVAAHTRRFMKNEGLHDG
ncbi:MAG: TIGR04282 family arsenosugar biosynthesis glycosyltransferase [Anaerolineales bacterium]|nr:TIGR04282 family arsenosugar biosynthesis glycosyltransferase [Anaerolineales bacterium]